MAQGRTDIDSERTVSSRRRSQIRLRTATLATVVMLLLWLCTVGGMVEPVTAATNGSDTLTISGTITDEDGNPLEDATVKFNEDNQTTTDSNGDYQLKVSAGSSFEDDLPTSETLQIKHDTVDGDYSESVTIDSLDVERDIELQLVVIEGTVSYDETGALDGATINLIDSDLSGKDIIAQTDSNSTGAYELRVSNDTIGEEYPVNVTHGDLAVEGRAQLNLTGKGGTQEPVDKDIQLTDLTVYGYVMNKTGTPVENAVVRVVKNNAVVGSNQRTNSSGYYEVEHPYGQERIDRLAGETVPNRQSGILVNPPSGSARPYITSFNSSENKRNITLFNTEQQWRYEGPANLGFYADSPFSAPTVKNGTVYFINRTSEEDPRLLALNASTGTVQWRQSALVDAPLTGLSVVDGTVFTGRQAFDAQTGNEEWKTLLDSDADPMSPQVASGTVFVSLSDTLYALDAESGAIRWQSTVSPESEALTTVTYGITATPVVTDGLVLVPTNQSELVAFNVSDGAQAWRYDAPRNKLASPTVSDGRVFITGSGRDDDDLAVVDAATGTEIETYEIDIYEENDHRNDVIPETPTVWNGIVYLTSDHGNAYGVNPATGESVFEIPDTFVDFSISAPPTVTERYVYSSQLRPTRFTVVEPDGEGRTQFRATSTRSGIDPQPLIVNGTLFVGYEDFYAIDLGTTETSRGSRVQQATHGHHGGYDAEGAAVLDLTVVNDTGVTVPNAAVTVEGEGKTLSGTTGDEGNWTTYLPAGTYELTVEHNGTQDTSQLIQPNDWNGVTEQLSTSPSGGEPSRPPPEIDIEGPDTVDLNSPEGYSYTVQSGDDGTLDAEWSWSGQENIIDAVSTTQGASDISYSFVLLDTVSPGEATVEVEVTRRSDGATARERLNVDVRPRESVDVSIEGPSEIQETKQAEYDYTVDSGDDGTLTTTWSIEDVYNIDTRSTRSRGGTYQFALDDEAGYGIAVVELEVTRGSDGVTTTEETAVTVQEREELDVSIDGPQRVTHFSNEDYEYTVQSGGEGRLTTEWSIVPEENIWEQLTFYQDEGSVMVPPGFHFALDDESSRGTATVKLEVTRESDGVTDVVRQEVEVLPELDVEIEGQDAVENNTGHAYDYSVTGVDDRDNLDEEWSVVATTYEVNDKLTGFVELWGIDEFLFTLRNGASSGEALVKLEATRESDGETATDTKWVEISDDPPLSVSVTGPDRVTDGSGARFDHTIDAGDDGTVEIERDFVRTNNIDWPADHAHIGSYNVFLLDDTTRSGSGYFKVTAERQSDGKRDTARKRVEVVPQPEVEIEGPLVVTDRESAEYEYSVVQGDRGEFETSWSVRPVSNMADETGYANIFGSEGWLFYLDDRSQDGRAVVTLSATRQSDGARVEDTQRVRVEPDPLDVEIDGPTTVNEGMSADFDYTVTDGNAGDVDVDWRVTDTDNMNDERTGYIPYYYDEFRFTLQDGVETGTATIEVEVTRTSDGMTATDQMDVDVRGLEPSIVGPDEVDHRTTETFDYTVVGDKEGVNAEWNLGETQNIDRSRTGYVDVFGVEEHIFTLDNKYQDGKATLELEVTRESTGLTETVEREVTVQSVANKDAVELEVMDDNLPAFNSQQSQVDVKATNFGNELVTQDISLIVDGEQLASQEVTLGAGQSRTVRFDREIGLDSKDTHTVVVASEDDHEFVYAGGGLGPIKIVATDRNGNRVGDLELSIETGDDTTQPLTTNQSGIATASVPIEIVEIRPKSSTSTEIDAANTDDIDIGINKESNTVTVDNSNHTETARIRVDIDDAGDNNLEATESEIRQLDNIHIGRNQVLKRILPVTPEEEKARVDIET